MKFTSSPWSAVSGSIGGTTYGRGPFGGLVARVRATPANPNTLPQQAIRAAMGVASAAWGGTLTDAQRTAWEAYASLTPLTGPLGGSIQVGGLQMYQRWASLRSLIGESVGHPAPLAISGLGQPVDSITGESMIPAWDVGVSGGASDDGDVIVQVSVPLNTGQSSIHRALTFDASAAIAGAATTVAVTPGITLSSGERYVVRSRLVYDDGRVSASFTRVVTIVT